LKRELGIAEQERDISKSRRNLLTEVRMKYEIMAKYAEEPPVSAICQQVLAVSGSGLANALAGAARHCCATAIPAQSG
jgi:hypothetical protein